MMRTRRRVIAGLLGALALAGAPDRPLKAAQVGRRTKLNPAEPAAVAIAYIENAAKVDRKKFPAFKRGQSCQTCALLEPGTSWERECSIVPGRLVMATGWCKAWVPRGR